MQWVPYDILDKHMAENQSYVKVYAVLLQHNHNLEQLNVFLKFDLVNMHFKYGKNYLLHKNYHVWYEGYITYWLHQIHAVLDSNRA